MPGRARQLDEAGPRGRHLPHLRRARGFRALLGAGLFDLFRERHPDAQAFTWWDLPRRRLPQEAGAADRPSCSRAPVLDRVAAFEIDREYRKKQGGFTASDHARYSPISADPLSR